MTHTRTSIAGLIQQALKMINEISRDEAPSSELYCDGLNAFNNIIDQMSFLGNLMPYNKTFEFDTTVGRNLYVISPEDPELTKPVWIEGNLITSINALNIIYQNQQIPVKKASFEMMYKAKRVLNNTITQQIAGMPNYYYHNNTEKGSFIDFDPAPYQAFHIELRGIFNLDNTDNIQEIYYFLPAGFNLYFIYRLAKELSVLYNSPYWNADKEMSLQKMENDIRSKSVHDTSYNLSNDLCSVGGAAPWTIFTGTH